MSWGNGLSLLPDLEGVDIWSDPPEIEEPPGTRRRMRVPRIERLRPRYEAELGDELEVENALDEEERRADERSRVTLGEPSPERSEYLQEGRGTLLGRIRQQRAEQGRTSATTGEYLGAAGGAAGYTLGGLVGLGAEEAFGQGLEAVGVKRPTFRSRDKEGNVKPLGAEELAYNVGPDVAVAVARPAFKGARALARRAGENPELQGGIRAALKGGERGAIVPEDLNVFHGTDSNFEGMPQSLDIASRKSDSILGLVYYSTDPSIAKGYGSRVIEGSLPKGTKIFDPSVDSLPRDLSPSYRAEIEEHFEKMAGSSEILDSLNRNVGARSLINALKKEGYQGFKGTSGLGGDAELALWDQSVVRAVSKEEPLSDIERLLQQSLEAGPEQAKEIGGARARNVVRQMREEDAIKGEPYAEATRLSRKAAQLAGEVPETTRKRAIKGTKTALDSIKEAVKRGEKGMIRLPDVPSRQTKEGVQTPLSRRPRVGEAEAPLPAQAARTLEQARLERGLKESTGQAVEGAVAPSTQGGELFPGPLLEAGATPQGAIPSTIANPEEVLRYQAIRKGQPLGAAGGPPKEPPTGPKTPEQAPLGDEFAPIEAKTPHVILQNLAALLSASKRIQTSGDILGASLRQGLPTAFIDPKIWGRNAKRGLKAYFEDPEATGVMDEIARMPRWADNDPARAIKVLDPETGELTYFAVPSIREVFGVGDDFQTPGFEKINDSLVQRLAELYPLTGRSEKSMRAVILGSGGELYNGMVDSAARAGITDPSWYEHYGDIARVAVGYGDVPQILKGFSNAFYSLRNTAARFQALTQPFTKPGAVFDPSLANKTLFSASPRGVASRHLFRFAGGEIANLRLLAAAGKHSGLFEVGYNPLESGFGRLTLEDDEGNDYATDLLGGYGSMVKALAHSAYTAQEIAEGKSREEWTFDPAVDWINFGRYKMTGQPGAVVDTIIANSGLGDVEGLETPYAINLTDPKTWTEGKFLRWYTPFFSQDSMQALIEGDLPATPDGLFKAGGLMMAQLAGLGSSLYPANVGDIRDQVSQEKFQKNYEDLVETEKVAVKQDERVVAKAAEEPSSYQQAVTRELTPVQQRQDAAELAFEKGELTQKISDIWHDIGIERRAKKEVLVNEYLKGLQGQDKDKFRQAVDTYYKQEVTNSDGTIDWDATEAAQQSWLKTQPDDTQAWLNDYLAAQRLNQSPLRQRYLSYLDTKEKAGYFKPDVTPAQKEALDAKNPNLDVEQWFFGGGRKDDKGKPVAGPALQSDKAVQQALAMNLPDRPIKRDGLDRPINETPKTVKAWQYSKGPVQFYLDSGGQDNLDTFAQADFGVPYAKLKDEDKTKVRTKVQTAIRKDPELEAWLLYWGRLTKATSQATADKLGELYRQYGAPPPKEKK